MTEAQKISAEILGALPNVKCGSLRFWGAWFGRPYDNIHRIVASEDKEDVLKLNFKQEERLTRWRPQGLELSTSTFQIQQADRVLWEWFYYRRPRADKSLFFYDFVKTGDTVAASSNVNWYTPDLSTNLSMPAVEIL